jgi:arylsulfatase A-like enzyme
MTATYGITRRELMAAAALPAARTGRPHVVLILADDLGYGDVSSWGARDVRTPNIDALAASGVRFGNFYANSPVCSPTRAALLTGRYPDCVGVPGVIRTRPNDSWGWLAPSAELLPRRLKTAGYNTALVGKWHLGLESPSLPNERGFDHFHGFLGDMMDDYLTHRREGHNYMRLNGAEIDPRGHATDLFTDWAVEYVNGRKARREPFFLYLAYNAPHAPIQPPAEWLERVRRRDAALSAKRAAMVALIEHMDAGVGRVVEALKANGQYENTLMIFVSDNGGDLNAGGTAGALHGGKGQMFEGGIRVPMCAAWPGRIQAGSRSERVGLTMDIFATACEAAGAEPPTGIDGVSLMPELLGRRTQPAERDLAWVRREGGAAYQGREFYAYRRGDWKLLQNTPFQPYELYNLKDDPGEQHNVAASEPKIYRELAAALMRHIQRAGATPWQAPVR